MAETILEKLAKRVSLPVQDEEYLLAKKVRKAISNIKRLPKSRKIVHSSRGGLYSMGARGVYIKEGDIYTRRVIIKAKIIKNRSESFKENISGYLKYISRADAGIDGKKPELLSADEKEINQKDIIEAYSKAPHSFRFIISPEDGDKLDLKEFTKNLLNIIDRDLETKLDWVAAIHFDTNEPHVHLLVNGNDRYGHKLLMTRDYISNGMRNRACKIVTNKLGLREYDDIIKSLSLEINSDRTCLIDKIIKNHIGDNKLNLSSLKEEALCDLPEGLVKKRLVYLESKGIAKSENDNYWSIREDFIKQLNELNRTRIIIDRLSTGMNIEKELCHEIRAQDLLDKEIEGSVVKRGYIDAISDREFLVIKSKDHKHHYVELEKYSEKVTAKIGEMVRIGSTKIFGGPKASDHTIDKEARENGGIYDAKKHEASAKNSVHLPPGVSPQQYVQVHINRLAVLGRKGLVDELGDGQFLIPKDYLEKISIEARKSEESFRPHLKVIRLAASEALTLKQKNGHKPC